MAALTPTAKYVAELAAANGVRYELTYGDVWAHHVTRLSGDEVHPDETENLLVALARAGKISGREMTQLTVTHLREKKAAEAGERQEAEVLASLQRHGTVLTTEIETENWSCEVLDPMRQRKYQVGGGGDAGLFRSRLSAMKWCLRVIENTLDGGYFDVPAHQRGPAPSM